MIVAIATIATAAVFLVVAVTWDVAYRCGWRNGVRAVQRDVEAAISAYVEAKRRAAQVREEEWAVGTRFYRDREERMN